MGNVGDQCGRLAVSLCFADVRIKNVEHQKPRLIARLFDELHPAFDLKVQVAVAESLLFPHVELKTRLRVDVQFADDAGPVTGGVQLVGKRVGGDVGSEVKALSAVGQFGGVAESDLPVGVGKKPGQHCRPRRAARGGGDVAVFKPHRRLGKGIEPRRDRLIIAVTTQLHAQVVGGNQQQVEPRQFSLRDCGEHQQREKESNQHVG